MKVKAVELIRKIRDRHYQALKGKTLKEQRAFYAAKAQALEQRVQLLRCQEEVYGRQPQATRKKPAVSLLHDNGIACNNKCV